MPYIRRSLDGFGLLLDLLLLRCSASLRQPRGSQQPGAPADHTAHHENRADNCEQQARRAEPERHRAVCRVQDPGPEGCRIKRDANMADDVSVEAQRFAVNGLGYHAAQGQQLFICRVGGDRGNRFHFQQAVADDTEMQQILLHERLHAERTQSGDRCGAERVHALFAAVEQIPGYEQQERGQHRRGGGHGQCAGRRLHSR